MAENSNATLDEKVKRRLNPKKALYAGNLLFLLAIIGVMTLGNVIIDPEHFSFFDWMTNSLILIGIQIPSILLGESMSDDRTREKIGGMYQRAIKRYRETFASIKGIKRHFSQYYLVKKAEELEEKKMDYLMRHDIDAEEVHYIVRYVKATDLDGLRDKPLELEGGVVIDTLTPEQIEVVRKIYDGSIQVNARPYAYFLTESNSKRALGTDLESPGFLDDEAHRTKVVNRIRKIGAFVIFSLIFAMFVIDSASDMSSPQTWVNLLSRLASFGGGMLSGWMTSITVVRLLAMAIDKKSDVLDMFKSAYDTGAFVPKSYEQRAKEHAEAIKKEEREAVESVVVPEPIETPLLEGGNANGK